MSQPVSLPDIRDKEALAQAYPEMARSYAGQGNDRRSRVAASLALLGDAANPTLRSVLPNRLAPQTPAPPAKKIVIPGEVSGRKLSVLFAPTVIAGNAEVLSNYLKKRGHKTATVDYFPNYLGYQADYIFDTKGGDLGRFSDQCLEMAQQFDAVIFEFGCSFKFLPSFNLNLSPDRPPYWDIARLKDMGKIVLCSFWGSDVRSQSQLHFKLLNHLGVDAPAPPMQTRNQFNIVNRLAGLADAFLAVGNFDVVLPRTVPFWETPVHLDRWPFRKKGEGPVRNLLTAPTSRRKKNYELIDAAVKAAVAGRPQVSHKLVEKIPHSRIAEYKASADLAMVNVGNGFGLGGVEFMSLGVPVMAANPSGARHVHRDEAPAISFSNLGEMYDKLTAALDGDLDLAAISEQGRAYAEKYHAVDLVGGALVNYLAQAEEAGYVSEVFSRAFQANTSIWQTHPDKVPAFKYFDISVPAFCALGDPERAIMDCNEAVANGYRPGKFHAWRTAVRSVFGINPKGLEKHIEKLRADGQLQQLEMIKHHIDLLGDVDRLIGEVCRGQEEASEMMGLPLETPSGDRA